MVESTIAELRGAWEAKRLVVVAGAAVSVAAGLPSRTEVVRRLVDKARTRLFAAPERLAEIESFADCGHMGDAFAALEDVLTPAGLGAEVERFWYAEDKAIPQIAAVIAALGPKLAAVLSLALDRVLPRALGGGWHTFARVQDDLGQRAGRQRFLLQLHGTLFERETWVLTAQQVADASFNNPGRKATLGAFLRSHTLLFVGCDADRGDLDPLLDELAAAPSAQPPRHFAMVRRGSLGPWKQDRLRAAGIELLPFDDARGDLRGAAELLATIGGLPLPPAIAADHPPDGEPVCPFPGLACFEETDAAYFFGRDHDVDEAVSKLGGPAGVRWLQIEGASGTGKSSLARAGLVPALRARGIDGGPQAWEVAVLRPGTEPLFALASAVRPLAGDGAPPLGELCELLAKPGGLATFVRQHVAKGCGLLLVVDHLEEAVRLGADERAAAAEAFDKALSRAVRDANGPLYLVTTIRSDHVGRLEAGLPQLAALLNSAAARYTLRSMGGAALRAAIEAPARKACLEWEGDLAAHVLADAGGTSSGLPLVAHVLRALFDRREGRKLTLAAYEALGGVAGALTKSADDVLAPLCAAGKECARKMLLRLVKIGRGTSDSRRPTPRAEVLHAGGGGPLANDVLDRLAGSHYRAARGREPARLVVVGAEEGIERVDLVHEALLRQWQTLADWIEEHRKALEKRDDLEHQAQAWVAAGRSDSGLATGAQLAYLRGAEAPHEQARVFLVTSEKRDGQRRRLQTMGFAGVIAALVALTLWALASARAQERARRDEVLAANVYAARAVAGTVLVQLKEYAEWVATEARDPELAEALVREDGHRLQALSEAVHARHAGGRSHIDWWFILDTKGYMHAHVPIAPFGQSFYVSFAFRDYFRNGMAFPVNAEHPVYVSRSIHSTSDDCEKLVIVSPIRSRDGTLAGLLAAEIATDRHLGALELSDGRQIAVLTVRRDRDLPDAPLPEDQTLLVHDGVEPGENVLVDSDALRRLTALRHAAGALGQEQLQLAPPDWIGTDDNYHDPLGGRGSHGVKGPWLAGMAAVGHTELTVIVQTSVDDATKLDGWPSSLGAAAVLLAVLVAWLLVRLRS